MPKAIKKGRGPESQGKEEIETCSGQCGYSTLCRACEQEKRRLIQEKKTKAGAEKALPTVKGTSEP